MAGMTTIIAIDPGPERSAWLAMAGDRIAPDEQGDPLMGILPNDEVVVLLRRWHSSARAGDIPFLDAIVIETIEPWGGFTGPPALATMRWVGRFEEAVYPVPVTLRKRSETLARLGIGRLPKGQAQAAVRALLIERWGGEAAIRKGGPLKGVKADLWSALALAVTLEEEPR